VWECECIGVSEYGSMGVWVYERMMNKERGEWERW
jgi:hypothetical protein